jgi:hypothetical protein
MCKLAGAKRDCDARRRRGGVAEASVSVSVSSRVFATFMLSSKTLPGAGSGTSNIRGLRRSLVERR